MDLCSYKNNSPSSSPHHQLTGYVMVPTENVEYKYPTTFKIIYNKTKMQVDFIENDSRPV